MGFAKAKLLISRRSRNYCLFDAVAVRLFFSVDFTAATTEAMQKPVVETIEKGTPPNYEPFVLALKTECDAGAGASGSGKIADALNPTVWRLIQCESFSMVVDLCGF